MKIEEAIEKAIRWGYPDENVLVWSIKTGTHTITSYPCLIDPFFWQSLSKGLNENKSIPWEMVCEDCGTTQLDCECRMSGRGARTIHLWKWLMIKMIEWLADGKSAETYFAKL